MLKWFTQQWAFEQELVGEITQDWGSVLFKTDKPLEPIISLRTSICVYICIYMYIYVYICICIYICIYIHIQLLTLSFPFFDVPRRGNRPFYEDRMAYIADHIRFGFVQGTYRWNPQGNPLEELGPNQVKKKTEQTKWWKTYRLVTQA